MNDKAGLAANQDYGKDELAAGKLLTKHTALQTAVNSYNPIIQALAEQATKLIHSGHFAAAKIATRQVESLARDKNSETIKGLGTILSDFVANSYGEFRESSCEKSLVPVQTHWVPVQENKESSIENTLAITVYVTRQLI